MRPLERDDVDGLLDDAHDRAVAPRVGADHAELLLGQVAAVAAEVHALLHLADRLGERERLLRRHGEQVERQPLRGARADPGQARQLRDEVVDGGAQHEMWRLVIRLGRARGVQGRFGHALEPPLDDLDEGAGRR